MQENAKKMPEFASPGSRAVAVIIDQIILWIVIVLIAIPLGSITAVMTAAGLSPAAGVLAIITAFAVIAALSFIVTLAYFTYFESTSGQTLGKKIMAIKVIKEDGSIPSLGDAFLRTLLRIVDGFPAFYLIGLIVILVSEKKQRIGDMAAQTIVVKE